MGSIDQAFARIVTRELDRQRRTVPWLAEESGIPERTLRSILRGEQATVKLWQVCEIAQALDLDCATLVARADALVKHPKRRPPRP